jgi:L-ascorbate metabolism protein UlaG (beta-lactamase superfamily)
MDIQFYGANCVAITYKGVRFVTDDNLAELGSKSILKEGDVALYSSRQTTRPKGIRLDFDGPGEFEISNISVVGVPTRSHMDEPGGLSNTMYKIISSDLSVIIAGHPHPDSIEADLEDIGIVDVLIIPVGGSGYTLDPIGAAKVIREIEPKLVIPTHYSIPGITYPVPQTDLESAIKDLGMEPKERTTKLKLKSSDLTEGTHLVIVEKA